MEADLYTAQGFEVFGAGLTGALLMAGGLSDSDASHGWPSYQAGNASDATRRRRASKDFWTDAGTAERAARLLAERS